MTDEVKRRLVHASSTAIPALYVFDLLTWTQLRWLMVAASVGTIALEALRLLVGLDLWIFDKLTREYEQDALAGYALGAFSITAVVVAFQPDVAIPAILMLTIGDPISGLLGSDQLRKVKRPRVLAAMFAVCLVLAYPFLRLPAAVLPALAATAADGVKPRVAGFVIDDNLSIPLAAGVVGYLAVELLPAAV